MDSVTAFHLIVQEAPILLSMVTVMFIIGVSFYRTLLYASLICFIVLLFCFRNPTRAYALIDQESIVAPADGKIVGIEHDPKYAFDGYCYKISIVVSLLDAHINRTASGGKVTSVQYVPGNHVSLLNPDSVRVNEYTDVEVAREKNGMYKMRQVAGTLARRVVCWPKIGDTLKTGQVYGMILFGSRVELYLPKNVQLCVSVGQHIKAGSTMLGQWAY